MFHLARGFALSGLQLFRRSGRNDQVSSLKYSVFGFFARERGSRDSHPILLLPPSPLLVLGHLR